LTEPPRADSSATREQGVDARLERAIEGDLERGAFCSSRVSREQALVSTRATPLEQRCLGLRRVVDSRAVHARHAARKASARTYVLSRAHARDAARPCESLDDIATHRAP